MGVKGCQNQGSSLQPTSTRSQETQQFKQTISPVCKQDWEDQEKSQNGLRPGEECSEKPTYPYQTAAYRGTQRPQHKMKLHKYAKENLQKPEAFRGSDSQNQNATFWSQSKSSVWREKEEWGGGDSKFQDSQPSLLAVIAAR